MFFGYSPRFKSIRFIISIYFTSITILAMLFVGVTLYSRFSRTAEQNASISMQQMIGQVDADLERYLRNMMDISDLINFRIYMDQDLSGVKFREQLDTIIRTRKDIVSLEIFSNSGELIISAPQAVLKAGADVPGQNWFRMAVEEPNKPFFSTPHVQNLFKGQHTWVVSLSRNITFYRMDESARGILLVDMNFKSIDDLCSSISLGKKGYIYITDPYGGIIYHPQQQLIYMGLKDEDTYEVLRHPDGSFIDRNNGEKRMVTVKTVGYTGWRIAGISYIDEIVTTRREIGNFAGLILVSGILFVTLASVFMSARVTKPIKKLEMYMKTIEKGRFDITVDVKGDDEVEQLSKAFNLMVAKIRNLMDQIVREQEEKRKSDFNALQAQVNPHFLYNTLDSIIWMAHNSKIDDAVTMVSSLAKFFRLSISRGMNIISVAEELEHARNYLIIQKIRFKNKFEFTIDAGEEVLQLKTLKLLLQPIVENSIYHGIQYMVDKGLIRISASVSGDKLLLQISDNGLGMSEEVLADLLSGRPESSAGSGVGVKNVNDRIRLYFGSGYGLECESKREEGTTVRLWLPIMKEG